MLGIKYFPHNLNIKNKKVVVRVDLNVPLKDKKIVDTTRIKQVLPFLQNLLEKKAKVILISHLGRPNGVNDNTLSLLPIYKYLKQKLSANMYFYTGEINDELKIKSAYLKESEILMMENIRFFKGEIENDEEFSKKLGELGEIYINNAFSCSHRKQSSIHNITKFVKEIYAGPLLEKEIKAIDSVIKIKKDPVTCIVGG